MEITKLMKFITDDPNWEFSRGEIIDFIAYNNDNWVMALKSLLIKNTEKYISKTYLYSKLVFMKDNPSEPHKFLDSEGLAIFSILSL